MFNQLSGATRLFPIIGDPITYVESPVRLTRTFGELEHNGICVPMHVTNEDFDVVMAGLSTTFNVDGILVTMPHKFAAFGHCATISERARLLGAVSVLRRNPDRTWRGDLQQCQWRRHGGSRAGPHGQIHARRFAPLDARQGKFPRGGDTRLKSDGNVCSTRRLAP
jgi:hypothetical protein